VRCCASKTIVPTMRRAHWGDFPTNPLPTAPWPGGACAAAEEQNFPSPARGSWQSPRKNSYVRLALAFESS